MTFIDRDTHEVLAHLIAGDVNYLRDAARAADGRLIVEIGSWGGWSAVIMAGVAPGSTVLCIDTWEGSEEHQGMAEVSTIMRKFKQNTEPYRNIIGLRMHSLAAAERLLCSVSLLFVDGAHDRASVAADICAWSPHMERGGAMLFHDCVPYDAETPESSVRTALDELGLHYTVAEPPAAHYIARVDV